MKKAGWMIVIFALMVLAQWLIPVNMITGSDQILEKGVPMKFRCAPVDPNDPFRGKYIVLQFDIARQPVETGIGYQSGQEVYLVFKNDSAGFSRIEKILENPPADGRPYLKTEIDYIGTDDRVEYLDFDLPFRRFYLEETKAPLAEELYRKAMADTTGETYGLVYLLNGESRIKDVIIRDTSIMVRLSGRQAPAR